MALGPATAQATTETAVAVQAKSTAKSTAKVAKKARVKRTAKVAMSRAARQRTKARTAVTTARKQIGDPYRWGASGPGAFDCSGLVQYAWRKAGISLPRVTGSQYRAVRKKVPWSKLRLGDLMFFYGKGHVGMYVGHGKMIHSPSSGKTVRIVTLKGYYRSAFAGAVRPGA
ncbi:C40 family peptidase [Streptosporangium saharense]|uniref:Cell wall-associated NlpC family hydrolase n=1 Tax=Streptosporangium saharense TaxID=1706840 RepID=A0A7W7QLY5_9ACTN|nr:C40 family peptidase [Streptosporangium saharense]MBB4916011.1 cell wall-associated NlpC family hydrolase [Streptosporangium saharense]